MDELDEIFGDFSRQIKLAASNKEFRGECVHCKEVLTGKDQVLTANGRSYHHNHFLCHECKNPIVIGEQYSVHPTDRHQYHCYCYEKKFYEECSQCHKPVSDSKILHASGPDGRKIGYHVSCFKCGIMYGAGESAKTESLEAETKASSESKPRDFKPGCGKTLEVRAQYISEYLVEKDIVYCHECYENYFIPTCSKCSRKIKGSLAPQAEPGSPVDGKKIRYMAYQGTPYCVECYNEHVVPTCFKCKEKIMANGKVDSNGNRYLSASSKSFHVDCFKCNDCNKFLNDLKAYLWKDEVLYCIDHYQKRALQAGVNAAAEHRIEVEGNDEYICTLLNQLGTIVGEDEKEILKSNPVSSIQKRDSQEGPSLVEFSAIQNTNDLSEVSKSKEVEQKDVDMKNSAISNVIVVETVQENVVVPEDHTTTSDEEFYDCEVAKTETPVEQTTKAASLKNVALENTLKNGSLKRAGTMLSMKTLGRSLTRRFKHPIQKSSPKPTTFTAPTVRETYDEMIQKYANESRLQIWLGKYRQLKNEAEFEAKTFHDLFPTAPTKELTDIYLLSNRNLNLAVSLYLKQLK